MTEPRLTFVAVGPDWLGSDSRAAFTALQRLGQTVHVVDEFQYAPVQWRTFPTRLVRRLTRRFYVQDFAREICARIDEAEPDCLFIYKGQFVQPEVIKYAKQRGVLTINFYPDVSFMVHGRYIPRSLPLFDVVCTTKSYGIKDLEEHLGIDNAMFVPHGFDRDLHRPIQLSERERKRYGCDCVFIGTWSPKKEALLSHLRKNIPELRLNVWGEQWEKARSESIKASIRFRPVWGLSYTMALAGADICLGLLSEKREGASSGDLTTPRSFQIPASGKFMLHERNDEIASFYKEGLEAEFFETPEELVHKVRHFLRNPDKRRIISRTGHRRTLESDYSYDRSMTRVLNLVNARLHQVSSS